MNYVTSRADAFAKRFVEQHRAAMPKPKEDLPAPTGDAASALHSRLNKIRAHRKGT